DGTVSTQLVYINVIIRREQRCSIRARQPSHHHRINQLLHRLRTPRQMPFLAPVHRPILATRTLDGLFPTLPTHGNPGQQPPWRVTHGVFTRRVVETGHSSP